MKAFLAERAHIVQETRVSEGRNDGKTGVSPLAGLVGVFVIAAGLLWFVTQMAEQRGAEVLLRRYCDDPVRHVALVKEILTEQEPAGTQKRRPYIIAAKLLYIVQRGANEPVQTYLERLHRSVVSACR